MSEKFAKFTNFSKFRISKFRMYFLKELACDFVFRIEFLLEQR